jgi:hypothetical protein
MTIQVTCIVGLNIRRFKEEHRKHLQNFRNIWYPLTDPGITWHVFHKAWVAVTYFSIKYKVYYFGWHGKHMSL